MGSQGRWATALHEGARIRHLCASYASSASCLKPILRPDCHKICCCRLPNAAMAAVARDDEAEIRECCECLLLIFMLKDTVLQVLIYDILCTEIVLQQIAERRGTS